MDNPIAAVAATRGYWNIFDPGHSISSWLHVRPAKTQISLRIRAVWSESS